MAGTCNRSHSCNVSIINVSGMAKLTKTYVFAMDTNDRHKPINVIKIRNYVSSILKIHIDQVCVVLFCWFHNPELYDLMDNNAYHQPPDSPSHSDNVTLAVPPNAVPDKVIYRLNQ